MITLWQKFKDLKKFLKGKKTYITAVAVAALALANFFGYQVPPWAWKLLGAVGLGSIRAAWNKIGESLN